jgi:hypothetical protein
MRSGFIASACGGIALVLTACETMQMAQSEPAPAALPADVEIAAPGDDVPADVAAFLGVWEGDWGGRLDGKLAVERVTADGEAHAIYAWGGGVDGLEAGRADAEGTISDGQLVLDEFPSGARAVYELQDDGTLEGTYTNPEGRSTGGLFFKAGTS